MIGQGGIDMAQTLTQETSADAEELPLRTAGDGRLVAIVNGRAIPVHLRQCFPWSEPGRQLSLRDDEDREVVLVEDPSALREESRRAPGERRPCDPHGLSSASEDNYTFPRRPVGHRMCRRSSHSAPRPPGYRLPAAVSAAIAVTAVRIFHVPRRRVPSPYRAVSRRTPRAVPGSADPSPAVPPICTSHRPRRG